MMYCTRRSGLKLDDEKWDFKPLAMFDDNVLKFQSREKENVTRRANGRQRRIEKEEKTRRFG
jgi:hypothetical protein